MYSIGVGSIPGPIPFSLVMLYANVYGLSKYDSVVLWEEIRVIDSIWLDQQAKKAQAKPVAVAPGK